MADAVKYTLYYWPISFRGNFVRCLLDFAGESYREATTKELLALKNAPVTAETRAVFMAPPLLHDADGDLFIAQTPAIVNHLARKLALVPADPAKAAAAEATVGNCGDVINELTRGCGAKNWDGEEELFEAFLQGRFTKWMEIFEVTAARAGLRADSGFFLGTDAATFADTTVFATWATMEHSLPRLSPLLRRTMPKVMALCDRLAASSKGLTALFARQPCTPYCGGEIERTLLAVVASSPTLDAASTSATGP